MVYTLFQSALGEAPPHPAVDLLNLTRNDLRICFERGKMNTQLFQKYFNQIRYWNWSWISEHMALDASFIYCYCRHIDWCKISRHQRLTIEIVTDFETDISWEDLSANPHLTFDMLTQFATRLDWGQVCQNIVLKEDQIVQVLPFVDWYELSRKSQLSEKFIETYTDQVYWPRITAHQTLTDDFIDKHTDRVDWDYLSRHRPMKRKFIQDHADYVDWGLISDGQKLDEDFIRDNVTRVDWEEIAYGQDISEDFFEKTAIKTPDVWAAFTAGRQLTPDFIARNIRSLPARELTRFQTFTLAEIDTYAWYLDWVQLSVKHSFTQPGQTEIDVEFLRRHVDRIIWPILVQTHVLPVAALLEFLPRFTAHDIRQPIPLEILVGHPELVNRNWISQNCPLTVGFLVAAADMIDWGEIRNRQLPEDVVRAFPADLNLSLIPANQSSMSPAWIAEQTLTARQWTKMEVVDPRYWPLYASVANVYQLSIPADEFFRQHKDLLLAEPDFGKLETNVLLNPMAAVIHLCRPELANRIRFKIALNEINVPSSWDYLEGVSQANWEWIVRTHRLSEACLDRFQHKVDWRLVSIHQRRPFSEQFVRKFQDWLHFDNLLLPYDVTLTYVAEFGERHNWTRLTKNFQEWQMKQYLDYCNFSVIPQKTLSTQFIKDHFTFDRVLTTQPLSEAFIRDHITPKTYKHLEWNDKITLSQRFIQQYRQQQSVSQWRFVSNQTLSMPPALTVFSPYYISRTDLSKYSLYKLARETKTIDTYGPLNLAQYNMLDFWRSNKLSDATIRRLIQTVDWRIISEYQQLSPDFLEEFRDRISWRNVSQRPGLSEETIRRFQNYVIWPLICRHQKLTEGFIAEFADRVNWEPLSPFSAYF